MRGSSRRREFASAVSPVRPRPMRKSGPGFSVDRTSALIGYAQKSAVDPECHDLVA